MLDGRVLEASQVEYKPFGKPPLKREAGDYHAQRDTARTGSDQCSATQGSVLFSAARS